jgi:hypothetical protein
LDYTGTTGKITERIAARASYIRDNVPGTAYLDVLTCLALGTLAESRHEADETAEKLPVLRTKPFGDTLSKLSQTQERQKEPWPKEPLVTGCTVAEATIGKVPEASSSDNDRMGANKWEKPSIISNLETPKTMIPPKQVGVVELRVELLSVSLPGDVPDSRVCESDFTDDDDRPDAEPDHNEGALNVDGGPSGGSHENTVGAVGGSSGSSGASGKGKRAFDSEENGQDKQGNGKRRRYLGTPDTSKNLLRFACPYQVYERAQDCLRQGPRNPRGGCDGIYRLKYVLF